MFSQTAEYALRVMARLAMSPDTLVPTVTLADRTGVPVHYLAKVLQQLASAQLVTGRRGVRGGYKLARGAGEISLLQVVRAVTVVDRMAQCPIGANGNQLCPLHSTIDEATRLVIDLLEGRTLGDVVNGTEAGVELCDAGTANRMAPAAVHAAAR